VLITVSKLLKPNSAQLQRCAKLSGYQLALGMRVGREMSRGTAGLPLTLQAGADSLIIRLWHRMRIKSKPFDSGTGHMPPETTRACRIGVERHTCGSC
jgi:hypothetical protein